MKFILVNQVIDYPDKHFLPIIISTDSILMIIPKSYFERGRLNQPIKGARIRLKEGFYKANEVGHMDVIETVEQVYAIIKQASL